MTVIQTTTILEQLAKLGFKSCGNEFRRRRLRVRPERQWLAFQTNCSPTAQPFQSRHQRPGLWKEIDGPDGRTVRIFELPFETVSMSEIWDDETGDPIVLLSEMVDWVIATHARRLPEGWQCPSHEQLVETVPDHAFTLEIGNVARQAQLNCTEDRLSVSIPLHQHIPADLSPQRRAYLDILLSDIQSRCRMARVVELEANEHEGSIIAEVDLSGAPSCSLSRLIHFALDAVRHMASQTISAMELLVDPTVTSTIWETSSGQEHPAEGSGK